MKTAAIDHFPRGQAATSLAKRPLRGGGKISIFFKSHGYLKPIYNRNQ